MEKKIIYIAGSGPGFSWPCVYETRDDAYRNASGRRIVRVAIDLPAIDEVQSEEVTHETHEAGI